MPREAGDLDARLAVVAQRKIALPLDAPIRPAILAVGAAVLLARRRRSPRRRRAALGVVREEVADPLIVHLEVRDAQAEAGR